MMTKIFFELGSFPALSRSEIAAMLPTFSEGVTLPSNVLPGTLNAALSSGPEVSEKTAFQVFFADLGGSVRGGKILAQNLNSTAVEEQIVKFLAEKYAAFGKKIAFGIAVPQQEAAEFPPGFFRKLLQNIKTAAKKQNIPLRFINRDFRNIDAGTYFREKLWREENIEFFLFSENGKLTLAETFAAQNVEAFAERDYGKPERDMQVGMLPPKLALMMVNLARDAAGKLPAVIWDPFCGTGTILLEALRLHVEIFGSDLAPAMVAASRTNLRYFFPDFPVERIIEHDATTRLTGEMKPHVIVSEGYLGPIQRLNLTKEQFIALEEQIAPLYEKFFAALRAESREVILACPFWRGEQGNLFQLQKILEKAARSGYTVRAFSQGTKRGSLEFIRKDQVVGREIFKFVREKK